eukprot:IDg3958t1
MNSKQPGKAAGILTAARRPVGADEHGSPPRSSLMKNSRVCPSAPQTLDIFPSPTDLPIPAFQLPPTGYHAPQN